MIINYSDQPVLTAKKSVFLAGPTPRCKDVPSWRPTACRYLEDLFFDGIVYVPEFSTGKVQFNYDNQVEWEWEALEKASIIAFWVPRNKSIDMLGLTTNIEFGYYVRDSKVLYGRPDNADTIRYMDKLYKRHHNRIIYNDLFELCNSVVTLLSK